MLALPRAAGVGVLSVGLAVVLAKAFGTGHAPLYAVLLASSSAALILPIGTCEVCREAVTSVDANVGGAVVRH